MKTFFQNLQSRLASFGAPPNKDTLQSIKTTIEYTDGARAFREGKSIHTNPFRGNERNHNRWMFGWIHASDWGHKI